MGRTKFAKYSKEVYDSLAVKDADTIYAVNDTGDFSSASLDTEAKLFIGEKPVKMDAIPFATEHYSVALDSTSGDIGLIRDTIILAYQFYSPGVYLIMTHVTLQCAADVSLALKKVIPNTSLRPYIISSTTVSNDGYSIDCYTSVTLVGLLTITQEEVVSKATIRLYGSVVAHATVLARYDNDAGDGCATRMDIIKISN